MPRSSFGFSQIQQLPLNTAIDSLRNEKQSLHSQHSTFSILITLLTFVKSLCERVSRDTSTPHLAQERFFVPRRTTTKQRESLAVVSFCAENARDAPRISSRFALRTQATKSLSPTTRPPPKPKSYHYLELRYIPREKGGVNSNSFP